MTTIYFIRHSKSQKVNNILNYDNLQVQNEKQVLSLEGEELAKNKLYTNALKNIDILYSSNYVRAIGTAKYIAENNNIDINIISDLGERKFGVLSYDEIPEDFYIRQFNEENYKLGNGESQLDVRNRMYKTLTYILNNNNGKNIAIVTHSTALLYLLKNWCDIDEKSISYKNKIISKTQIDNCDIFKLVFDDNNNLIDIEKIN
jgi:broad specificity phosphatase PhoE